MEIKLNTPKTRSDEALACITQILHYMERIGNLKHGLMAPPVEPSKMKEGDQLWHPWTSEERKYFKGVRNMFAHARFTLLGNGAVRVKDKHPQYRTGKPEIHGLSFDKATTDWEWNAQEFQEFAQRLKTLVVNRFQPYFISTVTCHTCGQSVDGRGYLTCGHVEYGKGSDGSPIFRKPKGGILNVTATLTYSDDAKDKFKDTAMLGVVTYDGLDLIISSMERFDKIAIEADKKGTPAYVVLSD